MLVEVAPAGTTNGADLVAVGIREGEDPPPELRDAAGGAEIRAGFRRHALVHPPDGTRTLVVGLGRPDDLDAERLRVAAAVVAGQAGRLGARVLRWDIPGGDLAPEAAAAALVEGTELAAYRFDRYRAADPDEPEPPRLERLLITPPEGAGEGLEAAVRAARVAGEATNRARELQHLPANVLTPTALAEHATERAAAHDSLSATILGPEEIAAAGMGGLAAVAQGSTQQARFIVLRHEGGGGGETLGLVGKAVTFDSGGISIKPSARMHEMKMDMSGGAAVIEAMAAIAELGLPLDVVATVPATENMPSGSATRPGDIITLMNGKTVEVNNTDAEGRLALGDALTYCVRDLAADRVVDLATLTGAVTIALGSTYAAVIGNDDTLAAQIQAAGDRSGELAWRLPLHPEYKDLTRGKVADLTNASDKRKASTIYAASFLEEFVDGKPWAHLDIAGVAWDVGREYVGNGPTGFGVRLLIELARDLAAS